MATCYTTLVELRSICCASFCKLNICNNEARLLKARQSPDTAALMSFSRVVVSCDKMAIW